MAFASFVIPVFKTEAYLKRCLDSLVAQTDGDFEAIVVDDASPDNAAAGIVSSYDGRFTCIRLDRNSSTFQAKAVGARTAKGEYVVPLDSDDYVMPKLVERIKAGASTCPDMIVYQMSKVYRGKVFPVKYNHPEGRCSGEEAVDKLMSGRIFFPVCGKAIRRETFIAAYEGLGVEEDFYLNFTDDLCWLLPILFNTATVSFISYSGYRYWRHDDSMTKDVLSDDVLDRLAEQSQRCVNTVADYAWRLGRSEDFICRVRSLVLETIRWLLREMSNLPEEERRRKMNILAARYGADIVSREAADVFSKRSAVVRAERLIAKTLCHVVKYGVMATAREIHQRLVYGMEI